MIVVGLTGSIGMGKSTTAALFADMAVPVFDSDLAVQEIYSSEEANLVDAEFPGVLQNQQINRAALSQSLLQQPDGFEKLEKIVHPLVQSRREAFIKHHTQTGTPLVVLDIPLLFETGSQKNVDVVLVVFAPPDVQTDRVLRRPGMTKEKFEAIRSRQFPDQMKRELADIVVDTSQGVETVRAVIKGFVQQICADPSLWDLKRSKKSHA